MSSLFECTQVIDGVEYVFHVFHGHVYLHYIITCDSSGRRSSILIDLPVKKTSHLWKYVEQFAEDPADLTKTMHTFNEVFGDG